MAGREGTQDRQPATEPPEIIPPHLRDAIRELGELVSEYGDLSLGHGLVISNDIDKRCTCTCAVVVTDVKGPGQIKQGSSGTYTAEAKIQESVACHECKVTKYTWTIPGAPNGVTNRQTKVGSNELIVDVAKSVPKNTKFKISVSADAECKCAKLAGGGDETKTCTSVPTTTNEITVI